MPVRPTPAASLLHAPGQRCKPCSAAFDRVSLRLGRRRTLSGARLSVCFNPLIGIHFIRTWASSSLTMNGEVSIPSSGFTSFAPGRSGWFFLFHRCFNPLIGIHFIRTRCQIAMPSNTTPSFNPLIGIHFIRTGRQPKLIDPNRQFQSPHRDSLHSHQPKLRRHQRHSRVSIPSSGFTSFARRCHRSLLRRLDVSIPSSGFTSFALLPARLRPPVLAGFNPLIGIHFIRTAISAEQYQWCNSFNPLIGIHFIRTSAAWSNPSETNVSIPSSGFTSFARRAHTRSRWRSRFQSPHRDSLHSHKGVNSMVITDTVFQSPHRDSLHSHLECVV